MALLLVGVGVPLISSGTPSQTSPLLADIHELFAPKLKAFSVQPMDRDAILADAEDGRATLIVQGRAFDVALGEHELVRRSSVPMLIGDDGVAVPDPSYDFRSRFFRGTVEGDSDSRVLLTLTKAGVFGYVRTSEEWLHFEPLSLRFPEAEGMSITFRHEDMTLASIVDEEDAQRLPVDKGGGIFPPVGAATATSPGVETAGDKEFYDTYISCWYCKMDNVMSTVSDVYDTNFAWDITVHSQTSCTTTQCNIDQGRDETDAATLRGEFATKQASDRSANGETWDMNHLFSGKDFDGTTLGIAYLAGRYGVNQLIDGTSTYDGGSIDYEGGILVSHEMGHNFEGEHGDATSYSHCHFFFGTCWDSSTHYTVMYTPFSHEPSNDQEMTGDFSSTNIADMNACNNGNWAALSFTPGSYAC